MKLNLLANINEIIMIINFGHVEVSIGFWLHFHALQHVDILTFCILESPKQVKGLCALRGYFGPL